MIKNKIYAWLNFLYNKIINSKLMRCKNCNILITYPCNLGVDFLVFKLVRWILCFKNKNTICNNCVNCSLLDFNNHPNFVVVKKNKINIFFLKKIISFLNQSLYFSFFKIIYFIDFDFSNSFIFNYLLKLMEEPNYKIILIFSCLNIYNIPSTFMSRCHRYNLLAPDELYIYKWIKKQSSFYKNKIFISIRLNNNSPIDTLSFLKEKWIFRINILNMINNIFILNITDIINILSSYLLDFNLYILYTFFYDSLNYKYTNKIYNLDSIKILKKIKRNISIKNINLIIKKIISCINIFKKYFNINKEILIYDLSCNIHYLINKGK